MQVKIYTVETVLMQCKDGRLMGHSHMMRTVNGVYQNAKLPSCVIDAELSLDTLESCFNVFGNDPRQLSFDF
jgi:hypothetical protein